MNANVNTRELLKTMYDDGDISNRQFAKCIGGLLFLKLVRRKHSCLRWAEAIAMKAFPQSPLYKRVIAAVGISMRENVEYLKLPRDDEGNRSGHGPVDIGK